MLCRLVNPSEPLPCMCTQTISDPRANGETQYQVLKFCSFVRTYSIYVRTDTFWNVNLKHAALQLLNSKRYKSLLNYKTIFLIQILGSANPYNFANIQAEFKNNQRRRIFYTDQPISERSIFYRQFRLIHTFIQRTGANTLSALITGLMLLMCKHKWQTRIGGLWQTSNTERSR